jgi:hypothetical protein
MPYKTWAVGEEVLAADFQTYLQKQVIATFANAAARDAAITAPVAGQAVYLTGTGQFQIYAGAGIGWRPPFANPWGLLTYKTKTSNTTLPNSVATSILATDPITIPAGRILRVFAQHAIINTAATTTQSLALRIDRGAMNALRRTNYVPGMVNATSVYGDTAIGYEATLEVNLAAGSYYWTLSATATGGTAYVLGAADLPTELGVEDIGPAPGAVPSLEEG